MTPRILIIAGSDSGGGAGIQADIKTVTMLGGFATTAITAITAQNTLGVQAVHPVPTAMVIAQIESVLSDIGTDAIKLGMIGSAETANEVADRLAHIDVPIVFDPVMVATSGATLADAATIMAFRRLMALATVTTPNIPEVEALGGPAAIIGNGTHVALKGGHGAGATIVDQLLSPLGKVLCRIEGKRIDTTSTHGTGCTFAAALATGLGVGMPIEDAFAQAIRFVRIAICEAPDLGAGHGPLGHQDVRLDCGPPMRLSQISISGEPTEDLQSFYAVLGLKLIVHSTAGDYNYVRFESPGGVTLSVYPEGKGIYFECDDLDADVARLQARGLVFDELPHDQAWLWRQAWTRDPAGNLICLFSAGENRRYPPWRLP